MVRCIGSHPALRVAGLGVLSFPGSRPTTLRTACNDVIIAITRRAVDDYTPIIGRSPISGLRPIVL